MPVVACECSRAAAMSSDKLVARKGRLRQRYDDDDHRLVAGCVPYRVKKDDEGNPRQAEVLMVSTPNRRDMVRKGSSAVISERPRSNMVFPQAELCLGTLGVQEQEQPEQQQPQGSLQGLHLRHGGHRGARVMAGAGHPQPAMGLPAEAYQPCRYDWMREALAVLLERLSVIEPVAAAGAAVQELTDQAGMYMMLQATSDGAVLLC